MKQPEIFNKLFKRNIGVLQKIFISYIMLIVIPLAIIGVLTINIVYRSVSEYARTLSQEHLIQSTDNIDIALRGINGLVYKLSKGPEIAEFTASQFPIEQKKYNASLVSKAIQENTMYFQLFDTVAVYFSRNNSIVTDIYCYSPEDYFDEFFHQADMGYDDWIENVKKTHIQKFIPARNIKREGKEMNLLMYIKPIYPYRESDALLVATIDVDKFLETFNISLEGTNAYFLALDLDFNTIMQSDNIPFELNFMEHNSELLNTFSFSIDKEKYTGLYSSSQVLGIKYVYLLPESKILENTRRVVNSIVAIIFVTLVVALFATYMLVKSFYTPITSIMKHVNKNDELHKKKKLKSEIMDINTFIQRILSENTELNRKIDLQAELTRNRFFKQLIYSSNEINGRELVEMEKKFGLNLDKTYYHAVIVDTVDYGIYFDIGNTQDIELCTFAIINVMNELLENDGFFSRVVPLEKNTIVYIIGSDHGNIVDNLKKIYNELKNVIKVELTIVVGRSVSSATQLFKSYHNAMLISSYASKTNIVGVIDNKDVQPHILEGKLYYPWEKETELANNMKLGNLNGVKDILDQLYDKNFKQQELSAISQRYFISMLTCTFMRLTDGLYIENKKLEEHYNQILLDFPHTEEPKMYYNRISEMFIELCNSINHNASRRTKNLYSLKEPILDYIEKHYMNPNLSLEVIAENFALSYNYMCGVFNTQIGKRFTECLLEKRIEKSVDLLCSTSDTISQIASKVGYMSSSTYIKAFKKLHKITPGEYRERVFRKN